MECIVYVICIDKLNGEIFQSLKGDKLRDTTQNEI